MNKLTILVTLILALSVFLLPRKYFLAVFIIAACFVPTDQRIIVMGLDFTVLRILTMAGILRILLRSEQKPVVWGSFDKLVIAWVLCGAVIYSIQWMNAKAVINRCGVLFDAIGLYWLFRQTIYSWSDIRHVVRLFAVCVLALTPLLILQWITGKNPFDALGTVTTLVREGQLRCNGAFPHSIMLGLFWATLVPLFFSFARLGPDKILFLTAIGAIGLIAAITASSTPVLVFIAMVSLTYLYKWRHITANLAWIIAAMLVALHLIMSKPVWHLIARINVVSGSTGWHRYHLIDQAVKHFNEWAVLGCKSTAHWGWGLEDITNQYILEGVRGGLITLTLFVIVLFVAASKILRICLKQTRPQKQFLLWSVFVMLLGHYASFIGVSYFGQITMLWYMVLAITGLLIELDAVESRVTKPMPVTRIKQVASIQV